MRIKRSTVILVSVAVMAAVFGYTGGVRAEMQDSLKDEIAKIKDKINAKKDEISSVEEKIDTAKKAIERKRLEAVSLKNQIGLIDQRLRGLELDIESTGLEIEQAQLELQQLDLQIQQKSAEIERHREIIAALIRTMHVQSSRDYLELLLAPQTLSEFFARVQYLEGIQGDMGTQTKVLRAARAALDDDKRHVEEQKASLGTLEEALSAKRDEAQEQRGYKEHVLEETKSNEQLFQRSLDELRGEYQRIESEIQAYERDIRQKLEGNDRLPAGDSILSWPVPSRYITARFHDPDYPYRHVFEHAGIDIRAGQGTAIKAAAPGFVARAKRCAVSWCYSYIMIIHGNGLSTVYGHLSGVSVDEDQFVGRGDVIGYTGGTPGTSGAGPFVTGPHLHFETRVHGIPVDPMQYLF